jgi:hypothetical protein
MRVPEMITAPSLSLVEGSTSVVVMRTKVLLIKLRGGRLGTYIVIAIIHAIFSWLIIMMEACGLGCRSKGNLSRVKGWASPHQTP